MDFTNGIKYLKAIAAMCIIFVLTIIIGVKGPDWWALVSVITGITSGIIVWKKITSHDN